MCADREVKVKVTFDFAHLAESILAEAQNNSTQTHLLSPQSSSMSVRGQSAVSVPRTCPLGGADTYTPLLPPGDSVAKRPGRRAR